MSREFLKKYGFFQKKFAEIGCTGLGCRGDHRSPACTKQRYGCGRFVNRPYHSKKEPAGDPQALSL